MPKHRSPFLAVSLILITALLSAVVRAETSDNTPRQLGSWTNTGNVAFNVALDPVRNIIHFAHTDDGTLFYTNSSDNGTTWREPTAIAEASAPNLTVDRHGNVHLVCKTADGVSYFRRADQQWSTATRFLTPTDGLVKLWAPKIIADGADNIHIIYWVGGKNKQTAYAYKAAGQNEFDPVELWIDKDEIGEGRYGSLTLDHQGNVHIFYASRGKGPAGGHGIDRRIRFKDGSWGEHTRWQGRLLADWSMAAAVDADDVVHITTQRRVPREWKLVYMNNRAAPATLDLRLTTPDIERTETVTDLLVEPNGDIWITMGHRDGPRATTDPTPNIGSYFYFDAATKTWSERTNLSPPGSLNVSAREMGHPQLLRWNGQTHVFYAEKKPDEDWKHWHRILTPPRSSD